MNNLEFVELLLSFKDTLNPEQKTTLLKLLTYLNEKKLIRDLRAYQKLLDKQTDTAINKLKEASN